MFVKREAVVTITCTVDLDMVAGTFHQGEDWLHMIKRDIEENKSLNHFLSQSHYNSKVSDISFIERDKDNEE
tara:strand:+ start:303 stop:518 length:216 start_codon:yes stop_codon:yes gene_type:complete